MLLYKTKQDYFDGGVIELISRVYSW